MNGYLIKDIVCEDCKGKGILSDLEFGDLICHKCSGNGTRKIYVPEVSTAVLNKDYEDKFVKEL